MRKHLTWLLLSLSFGPLFGIEHKEEELTKKALSTKKVSSQELRAPSLTQESPVTHTATLKEYTPKQEFFTTSSTPSHRHIDLRQKELIGKMEVKKGNYTFSTDYNLKQTQSGKPHGEISTRFKFSW